MMSLNPEDYEIRIIVAGSRGYRDRRQFHEVLTDYIKPFDQPFLFISGKASSGADDLIIRWCQKFHYPCKEMPADWENLETPHAVIKTRPDGKLYNAHAGHERNLAMARLATHLLVFFDGKSPGTRNMLALAKQYKLVTTTILIEQESRP